MKKFFAKIVIILNNIYNSNNLLEQYISEYKCVISICALLTTHYQKIKTAQ